MLEVDFQICRSSATFSPVTALSLGPLAEHADHPETLSEPDPTTGEEGEWQWVSTVTPSDPP